MEIKYKRKNKESYMILDESCLNDGYESRMLAHVRPQCLMDFSEIEINNQRETWYDISGMESLEDYFEVEVLTVDIIKRLILLLHLSCQELEEYLIDLEHIWLSKESIYIKRIGESFDIKLAYRREQRESVTYQFKAVMEFILSIIDYSDETLKKQVYAIYELTTQKGYTLGDLIEYIQENERVEEPLHVEKIDLSKEDGFEYDSNSYEIEADDGFFLRFMKKIRQKYSVKEYARESFEDVIIEPDIEIEQRTVMLDVSKQKCAGKLIYDGDGNEENYMVEKESFRIGAKAGKNDASLHSKAVSRSHARIVRENDDYYIQDMNSLNGTYVNGRMLEYKESVKLKMMDTITFADVSYVFM